MFSSDRPLNGDGSHVFVFSVDTAAGKVQLAGWFWCICEIKLKSHWMWNSSPHFTPEGAVGSRRIIIPKSIPEYWVWSRRPMRAIFTVSGLTWLGIEPLSHHKWSSCRVDAQVLLLVFTPKAMNTHLSDITLLKKPPACCLKSSFFSTGASRLVTLSWKWQILYLRFNAAVSFRSHIKPMRCSLCSQSAVMCCYPWCCGNWAVHWPVWLTGPMTREETVWSCSTTYWKFSAGTTWWDRTASSA